MTEQKLPGSLSVYTKRDVSYGREFDPDQCAASVSGIGGWHWHQCPRKWKVEKRGHKWCKQHDPDNVEKRQRESDARYEAKTKARAEPYLRIKVLETKLLEYKADLKATDEQVVQLETTVAELLEALHSVNMILAVWLRDPAKLPNTLKASIQAVTAPAIRKAELETTSVAPNDGAE